ncbi:MAG TPA: PilZ domain-containing protein, partial [Azoarcus taiwanensis]|uniref:Cyclic diguanosine monophosphate-binding protein n=1 Tax=Azoarcus taiwanensis TaxID=666964 RepID=A0A972FAE4_9RHOO|nr:PilZ domain-containing protein [Azoarcus taiwanensis]NMG01562.1 PilZ domain-containing protein [Azoarcus taiwanensis]HRQ58367.1 PilZ domain-containing protein [Azoarcus taiwanensis]
MPDTQRRRFARIQFHSPARFSVAGHESTCELLDLCLKGALLTAPEGMAPALGEVCRLSLPLDDEGAEVHMDGEVAHVEDGHVGMVCREIDLDSLTHLRRLVELNLGDDALLHREFAALITV